MTDESMPTTSSRPRTTACHIDIPLRNCTVLLDGTAVVEKGRVVPGVGG